MPSAGAMLSILRAYWVFPLVVGWKLALIGLFSLPVPANDAFFFDGAVVHWLLHGDYVNPSIAPVFPTSATEYFSAYPPGYQAVLAVWMGVFGPTVEASQWLHGVLFSLYAFLALAFLRRSGVGPAAANIGACFLFGLTFHDRPDSLAHVLGLAAFRLWVFPGGSPLRARLAGALLIVFALGTSLHLGAMYAAMLWAHAALRARRHGWPWRSMAIMVVLPALLAVAVVMAAPVAWRGFEENLIATPSFTGLRRPAWDEMAKVARNAPGILLVAAGILLSFRRHRGFFAVDSSSRHGMEVLVPILLAACLAIMASLFVVHPNYIFAAAYPQVLIIGLWWRFGRASSDRMSGLGWRFATVLAVAVFSMRFAALTTWGVVAARDVSKPQAMAYVRSVVSALPRGAEVVVSSAYLYTLADLSGVRATHSDWPGHYWERASDRPACFVLTEFDYDRRYRRELEDLAARGQLKITQVVRVRRLPVPEDLPRLRRIVQHLSWAPVIARVEWL